MPRGARLPLDTLQPYLLDVPHPSHRKPEPGETPGDPPSPGVLSWPALFGNDRPVEIEVGFGKGLFLDSITASQPDVNFLGIEIERKYVLLTAAKFARRQRPNVKLACTEARWFMKACVAEASVQAMHVYFPDPWWKTKHKKRKLFTRAFADEVWRVLIPAGRLYFVTDVEDYFTSTLALLAEMKVWKTEELPARRVGDESHGATNFERKYRAEGRPIFQAIFVK